MRDAPAAIFPELAAAGSRPPEIALPAAGGVCSFPLADVALEEEGVGVLLELELELAGVTGGVMNGGVLFLRRRLVLRRGILELACIEPEASADASGAGGGGWPSLSLSDASSLLSTGRVAPGCSVHGSTRHGRGVWCGRNSGATRVWISCRASSWRRAISACVALALAASSARAWSVCCAAFAASASSALACNTK